MIIQSNVVSQVTLGRLGISAASPILAPAGGVLAVGLGSLSASFAADRAPAAVCAALGVPVPAVGRKCGAGQGGGGWTLLVVDGDWGSDGPEGVALRGACVRASRSH